MKAWSHKDLMVEAKRGDMH